MGLVDLVASGTVAGLIVAVAYAVERLRRKDQRPLIRQDAEWLEKRNERLRKERDEDREALDLLSRRVDAHDQDLRDLKRRFALALSHIRALRAFINANDLMDEAPEPPSGLNLDED